MRRLALLLFAASLMPAASVAQDKAPVRPVAHLAPAPARDVAKMSAGQQQVFLGAKASMEWLRRCNRPDGRFVYGFLPALCLPMEGDDYLAQVEATAALARSARYFHDDATTAIARQALLTLLLETTVDPAEPRVRHTAAEPQLVNRLASHGRLLRAIHALANPGKDLLDQGDQLANYLYQQQRPDGSLLIAKAGDDASTIATEAHQHAVGLALQGIIHSQRLQPAPWKLDALRKARAFYMPRWKAAHNAPLAVSHTPAYAEAYFVTKDAAFAESVFALNDWVCTLQYADGDPRSKSFAGGFQPWGDGRALAVAPDIRSAACAESLAEACRVARATGDVARYQRYGQALERSLAFLLTLQYTPERARHYVEEFRPAVRGAFYASHQDGNLRIDYTAGPLMALTVYLDQVAE